MALFPEPLRPSEGRKDDKYQVNPIEVDKKGKENQAWELPEGKTYPRAYDAFLVFIQKIATFLGQKKERGFEEMSEDALTRDIQELKALLQMILNADQSENRAYCARLSANWHRLLQGVQVFSHTKRKALVDIEKLKTLLSNIEHYPSNKDYKLGYYLSHFAGETWLPVPFREILKHLFFDHRVNQSHSTLIQWTEEINDILQR